MATTLQQSADTLARRPHAGVDVTALEAARDAHTRALDRWAERAIEVDGPDAVVRRFDATFALRRLSLATVQIARSADMATSSQDSRTALRHAWLMVRAHCSLESVRLRNAARAGLGLALAVLVAKETSVEHSFWVVLGALSVLRSNALGTGATALQALLGACIGFGIASALMVTVGGDETVLWIALPVVVFLAGYTPGAVNFVVGQASFTVFVVVMFNVIVPEGWRTGLVRVQDVAIGAAISVGVGALLWPRGARGVARREFAALLRTGFAHLRAALAVGLDDGSLTVVDQASDDADDAATRATAALEDLALEHGGGHVDRQAWESVLLDALLLKVASDGITKWARGHDPADGCGTALTALRAEGRVVEDAVDAEADRIERSGVTAARAAPVVLDVPDAIVACLATHAHQGLEGAIGLLWAHEWLVLVTDRPR